MGFSSIQTTLLGVSLLLEAAYGQGVLEALRQRTCNLVVPTPVLNLQAVPLPGKIDLIWFSPSNRPCDPIYEVTATRRGGEASAATVFNTSQPRASLTQLRPGIPYEITVTVMNSEGKSTPVRTSATPLEDPSRPDVSLFRGAWSNPIGDWTCLPNPDPPLCSAAAAGQCTPMTCAELAGNGRCMMQPLHVTDWDGRTVIQYCSKECGCPAVPTLRSSLAAPAAQSCCAFKGGQYWLGDDGKATNGLDN